jgi:hypothetical protein
MDEQNFLAFGLCLNKAEESIRVSTFHLVNMGLDGLITELKAMPDDDERAYLLDAAGRKRQGRYVLYSREWKEQLHPLARSWHGLHKQKESYQDILAGLVTFDQLKEGRLKIQKFHDALVESAGSADNHDLIKHLLRVQEATVQFLRGQDGKDRPVSKWTTLGSIRTVWSLPTERCQEHSVPDVASELTR